MSRDDLKARRLVNLTLALLDARRPMTVAEIASGVPGYGTKDSSSAAFRRSFERDKEDLRGLGIELEVSGSANDEVGYRIVASRAQLPPIDLSAEEASALALAAASWSLSSMASLAERALVKVEAGTGTTATTASTATPRLVLQPRLNGEGPDLADLLGAVTSRREVGFGYVTADGDRTERRLQPWGVVSWRSRWYVTGHDLDRAAQRTFRLSRIAPGSLQVHDPAAAFDAPDGVDLRAQLDAMSPERDEVVGEVRVRPGAGHAVRDSGTHLGRTPDGADRFEVRGRDLWALAAWIRSFAGDVQPIGPPELVRLTREGWERVAAGAERA